ncbi:hypothetical protein [Arenibacter certesii]|uniref:Uncharacterized protein n=1 Tax=Arenibacter certesii TaxID=228955 RepID=A0A918IN21_9FLAO|nr:hypothetical protein [Arenibacter certesii]GGW21817.1 hypothetical protein GCM10007383_00550 [Arenibacter certesii]
MKKSGKNKVFKVPDGYFDTFSDQLFSKMESERIDYTKGDDFSVPEGYFDTLTDKILGKLENEEKQNVRVFSLKRYSYIATSIAAVLLLVIVLQWKDQTISNNSNSDILANSDIEDYFELNGLGVSSYEIADMFPSNDMDITDLLDTQLDNESVIDYLSVNIKDIEELNLSNDD